MRCGRDDAAARSAGVHAQRLLPAEAFGCAAVIYSSLSFTLVDGFMLLERR